MLQWWRKEIDNGSTLFHNGDWLLLGLCGVPKWATKNKSIRRPSFYLPESFSAQVRQRGHLQTMTTTTTSCDTDWKINVDKKREAKPYSKSFLDWIESQSIDRIVPDKILLVIQFVMNLKPTIETGAKNCGTEQSLWAARENQVFQKTPRKPNFPKVRALVVKLFLGL